MANIISTKSVHYSFLALALTAGAYAHAGGLSISEMSASGIGFSNAISANTREIGALPYNPSLGAFHSQPSFSGHMMDIIATVGVTPENGTYTESDGLDNAIVPGTSINLPFDDNFAFVLNVNAPLGVQTKWAAGTFPNAAAYTVPGTPLPGLAHPTESRLEVVRISPSVAYKFSDTGSFALGIDHYRIRKLVFDAVAKQNKLDGDGWGINLSVTQKITPKLTFAADYHSLGSVDTHGEATHLLVPNTVLPVSVDNISVPWRLQLGLALDVTPDFMLEFDFVRIGWSNYETLEIEAHSAVPALATAFSSTSANHWNDTDAYRLGMQYRLSENLRLRAGYSFDESAVGDDFFSGRSPDSDRHMFGIGLGYDIDRDLTFDVGYMYVKFEDRNYSSTTAPTTGELNGTSAYNGDYEIDAHIIGMSLTKKF